VSEQVDIKIALKADVMRSDMVRGLVWFVNYAALDPSAVKAEQLDLHGAAMLPEDVEKFAHRWLAFSRSIDIEHDGVGRPVHVIESFFNGPSIASPAWPINSHALRLDVAQSKEALDGLRSGKLNSVSLDAYTFNKVVRLPVAQAKTALGRTDGWKTPGSAAEWATELVRDGYPGVISVKEVAQGLYIAQRSTGLPVAVHVTDQDIDVASADGPWARLAALVLETPSLVKRAIGPEVRPVGYPGVSQHIDSSSWDASVVMDLLAACGVLIGGSASENFQRLTQELYAHVDATTQRGFLPHHTLSADGTAAVSVEGVHRALASIDSVPEAHRAEARRHLERHLAEIESAGVSVKSVTKSSGILVGDLPGAR
jgi:hypothetical protein